MCIRDSVGCVWRREQFLKTTYDAYPTYSWRLRLKVEGLEKLRDTLAQIKADIKEQGEGFFVVEEKSTEINFDTYISERDAAYDAWKAYCEERDIPFDWDNFCLYAEDEYFKSRGTLSLLNPNTATLNEICEKFSAWQKVTISIHVISSWIIDRYGNHPKTKKEEE